GGKHSAQSIGVINPDTLCLITSCFWTGKVLLNSQKLFLFLTGFQKQYQILISQLFAGLH
ncbi:MAG: hypothetical protein LBG16_02660, partial [Elusimicrobiota bacterium]|nr:hypothetical protein [Elusimicrobiota bacterium]